MPSGPFHHADRRRRLLRGHRHGPSGRGSPYQAPGSAGGGQLGCAGFEGQPVRVTGVDAREKRSDQLCEHFVAQATSYQRADRLVARPGRAEVDVGGIRIGVRGASNAFGRHDPRAGERIEVGRNPEHETVGQAVERAIDEDECRPFGRCDQLVIEAEFAAQIDGMGYTCKERVSTSVDAVSGQLRRAELAAEAVARLEERHVGSAGPTAQFVGRGQADYPPSHDDDVVFRDLAHRSCSSPSVPVEVTSALRRVGPSSPRA